jgi:hypothetical protein
MGSIPPPRGRFLRVTSVSVHLFAQGLAHPLLAGRVGTRAVGGDAAQIRTSVVRKQKTDAGDAVLLDNPVAYDRIPLR